MTFHWNHLVRSWDIEVLVSTGSRLFKPEAGTYTHKEYIFCPQIRAKYANFANFGPQFWIVNVLNLIFSQKTIQQPVPKLRYSESLIKNPLIFTKRTTRAHFIITGQVWML